MTVSAPASRAQGYARGRAKRAEIIETATVLYGEVGYRGASLREIATRCGISHPGLLHHFPTKESLLLAVLEHRDAVDAELVGTDGLDRLRRLVDLVATNATRRGIVELYAVLSAEATAPDHPARDYFVARYARTVAALEQAYGLARRAGELRPDVAPAVAARQLVALLDGLQVQWLLDGSTDMTAVVRAHLANQLTVPL